MVIDPVFESGVKCYNCKQLCHNECRKVLDLNTYCNACFNTITKFWYDVLVVTSNCNWQHAMYQRNQHDKLDNFLIVDTYPENEITQEAAQNYNCVLKELHYKFASTAVQANPSSIISGDLITTDNESPLVNTLYHDLQRFHLNSSLIKI